MAPRAAIRDAARVLGYDYGTGRPPRQADPRADLRPQPELRGVPEAGGGAEAHLRLRSRRAEDPRHRPGSRGDRPQQLDPCGSRRDRRPPPAGDRPAAAGGGSRRPRERERQREREGREVLQDGHAVLDGPDRGDRPAEDGLPRPAQPRRDRGRHRDHPPLARRGGRHREDPARRPEDLRDARQGRLDRGLPDGVGGDAGRAPPGGPDRVRRPRRAQRPLQARGDGVHPDLREGQEEPRRASATPIRACARSPRRRTAASSTRSS